MPSPHRLRRAVLLGLTIAAATLSVGACATLQQIAQLRHVDFDLRGMTDVVLAGVELDRIRSYEDLSVRDIGRLALAVSRKDMPLEFVLDVGALNPADNEVDARMTRMDWTLFLDDRETVSGVVEEDFVLPPGEPRVLPIGISLDLYDFFDGGAEDLTDFVLSLVGEGGQAREVALRATPVIDTPLGPIRYPRPVTIVSRTVGDLQP